MTKSLDMHFKPSMMHQVDMLWHYMKEASPSNRFIFVMAKGSIHGNIQMMFTPENSAWARCKVLELSCGAMVIDMKDRSRKAFLGEHMARNP